MANIMTKRGTQDNIVTYEHFCDTTADIANISPEYITLGSIAVVLQGNSGILQIYMANSNKQWILLNVGAGESGEGLTLEEVNELIADALGDIVGFGTQIVNALPESNINTGTIYLVANNNGNNDAYDEYIYVNNNWQKIGSTSGGNQLQNIKDGAGQNSIEEGQLIGNYAVSATGSCAHAEGNKTKASGTYSHAEGAQTTASGLDSHAEGSGTTASNEGSHAEGSGTTASGLSSHAEGSGAIASGVAAHAEGGSAEASGDSSHAEGNFTIANHKGQHVFGQFNIADPSTNSSYKRGTYVEIVGNGSNASNRSNARTLDWSGNETLAGTLTTSSDGIKIGNTTLTESQLQSIFTRLAALEQNQ